MRKKGRCLIGKKPIAQLRPEDIDYINKIMSRGHTAEVRAKYDDVVIYEVMRKVEKVVAASDGTR